MFRYNNEAFRFLGDRVPCLCYHPAATVELARAVGDWAARFSQEFDERGTATEDIYAYAALLNRHGIIVGSESLVAGYEMLERLDTNAYVVNHWGRILPARRAAPTSRTDQEHAGTRS